MSAKPLKNNGLGGFSANIYCKNKVLEVSETKLLTPQDAPGTGAWMSQSTVFMVFLHSIFALYFWFKGLCGFDDRYNEKLAFGHAQVHYISLSDLNFITACAMDPYMLTPSLSLSLYIYIYIYTQLLD